jgi:hypothetical protein
MCWGEDEIKAIAWDTGELWHAGFGHKSYPNLKATSEAYQMFNIAKKQLTNEKLQIWTQELSKSKSSVRRLPDV